ncbi:MAG: hypothetical protein IPL26_13115 [Leptospiraceae bacterium]|nr:hypothetical protein [Leptospiraceae bacterium]
MNIYKNPINNEIHCSNDGCPQGYIQLGTDETIDDSNRVFVIGYENGQTIFSEEKAIQEKETLVQGIIQKYIEKENTGVRLTGTFQTELNETIVNPRFQYDEVSQNRLLKLKDFEDVYYWRTLDNRNVLLNVTEKNTLYDILISEWATDFDNRLKEIQGVYSGT